LSLSVKCKIKAGSSNELKQEKIVIVICFSIVTCVELIYWFILRWIRFARKPAEVHVVVVVIAVGVVGLEIQLKINCTG